MEPQELAFQLSSEDEQIVRSYKCTVLKRWFAEPSIGYLTVTNKRVVFHSSNKSLTGKGLLISEMPLEDVAGLNIYEGLSINWLLLIIFLGIAYFLTQTIVAILPDFLLNYWVAALLILPFIIIWLLGSNVLSEQIKERVFETFDTLRIGRDLNKFLPYTRILLAVGLAILGWRLASTPRLGLGAPLAWMLLLAVYAYIFMVTLGRRNSFSVQIGSKTLKDTGIYIPGDSFNLLPGRQTTAMQGLGSRPAEDASQVARELGALLMDMKQLGDRGIDKWKE